MDLDLDAFRAKTFDVKLNDKTYKINLARMGGYLEVLAARKELDDGADPETNLAILKRMVKALAPELPVDDLAPAELNMLLGKLDKFNSGSGGDSGNPVDGT